MSDPSVTEIGRIAAPYRREIVLQDVLHESGMKMLRVRIREGTRFTILDIDAATAAAWAGAMLEWSGDAARTSPGGTASGASTDGGPTTGEPSQ